MKQEPAQDSGQSLTGASRVALLGEGVRRRREELGLRQAELAELAGCSTRFVHTLERGKATLRLDKVLDVFEVLGLDLLVAPGRGRVIPGPEADPAVREGPALQHPVREDPELEEPGWAEDG